MLSTDDKNFPVALMGFSHQSCDLQFAPTLTLPSPRCHDNKQRKTLLHFDMDVCTWWDLFLKSFIFLGLGDQEAARSELRGPQVLGRVHLFGCRQVVFLFLKRRRIAEPMWNLKKRTMKNGQRDFIWKYYLQIQNRYLWIFRCDMNKMTAANLAVVFGPNLAWSNDKTMVGSFLKLGK